VELESYVFVLLRRPADAPDLAEEELDRLQEQHLAHLAAMAKAGKLVCAGVGDREFAIAMSDPRSQYAAAQADRKSTRLNSSH